MLEIFTDGACLGNPGPGGWAALIVREGQRQLIGGGEAHTTNNRMELLAAIRALEAVTPGLPIRLTTDSRYVMDGIEKWIHGWKRRQWRTAGGDPVKNQDLWILLEAARAPLQVQWCWVRGHNGHPENELVDRTAQQHARQMTGARSRS